MKRDEYTSKINRFGKALEKMLEGDFPDSPELYAKVDNHIASIQFEILGAFLKKGTIE